MKLTKAVATYTLPILIFFSSPAHAQVLTTIAGTGTNGFAGDGGLAVAAQLNAPLALCLDNSGNLYFTDYSNHRIRKIDSKGIISTIAGTGIAGFSGDGGPAINAQLNHPFRICTDNAGNVYFSDYDNLRVRKINLVTGVISTIGGNGTQVYMAGGLAINSGMLPNGLVSDGKGNLYVTQHNPPLLNNTFNIISKINLSTGIITTVAGNFIAGFSGDGGPALNASLNNPAGISIDGAGNLIIADQNNNRIRKVDLGTGIITTIVGDGGTNYFTTTPTPALQGSFSNLNDVFVDASGNLVAADENRLHIYYVNLLTGMVYAVAGNGYLGLGQDCVDPLTVPLGDCPSAVSDASGNLYFTDLVYGRIRKVIFVKPIFPSIQVVSGNSTACKGSSIRFTAQGSNVQGIPSYQWMVNGQPVGTDTSVFTTGTLSNGDMVSCLMVTQPAFLCDSVHHTLSNSVQVQISTPVQPYLAISVNSDTICQGGVAVFTASDSNAGSQPTYAWMVNGVNTDSTGKQFSTSGLQNGDQITCLMRVDPTAACTHPDSVISMPIRIFVKNQAVPSIQIQASRNPLCQGDTVQFTASIQNAGVSPGYQWYLNGISTGQGSPQFLEASLKNGDQVSCRLIPGSGACAAGKDSSNMIVCLVNDTPQVTIQPADTVINPGSQVTFASTISGAAVSFQWTPANLVMSAFTPSTISLPINQNTDFTLLVTSSQGCQGLAKSIVEIYVPLAMPSAFTPNGDGINDVFRIPQNATIKLEEFSVYDRWGNRVFSTQNASTGWDGFFHGIKQGAGTYVYYIKGTSLKGPLLLKGTFLLIR